MGFVELLSQVDITWPVELGVIGLPPLPSETHWYDVFEIGPRKFLLLDDTTYLVKKRFLLASLSGQKFVERDDILIDVIQQISMRIDVQENRTTSGERLYEPGDFCRKISLDLRNELVFVANIEKW